MRSMVISFRIPEDLYEEFERKRKDEGISPAAWLREFVDGVCYKNVDEPETRSLITGGPGTKWEKRRNRR